MKIVVASESKIKINAVEAALRDLGIEAEVVGVAAQSKVNEQPVDSETLRGARNRFRHAQQLEPSGDYYISIENGIFQNADKGFSDKAVVLAATEKMEALVLSEALPLPMRYVDEARKIGFDKTTPGKVMEKHGVIVQHDDPHKDLAGKSRETFLTEAATRLFRDVLQWKPAAVPAATVPQVQEEALVLG